MQFCSTFYEAHTRRFLCQFCAISLHKQAIFGDMWHYWRAIILLILLSLFVAVCPWIPTIKVCGTEGHRFDSYRVHQPFQQITQYSYFTNLIITPLLWHINVRPEGPERQSNYWWGPLCWIGWDAGAGWTWWVRGVLGAVYSPRGGSLVPPHKILKVVRLVYD